MQKKLLQPVLLVLMMISLTACEPRVKLVRMCPASIEASDQVKGWYRQHKPLPPYMREYLKAIGDQQEMLRVK